MLQRIPLLILILVLSCGMVPPLKAEAVNDSNITNPLFISEVQISGLSIVSTEDTKSEFIELYNSSDEAVDVNGWQLQYMSATHNGLSAPTRILGNLTSTIPARGFIVFAYSGYFTDQNAIAFVDNYSSGSLAKNGSIRLVDNKGILKDLVGWGSANLKLGKAAKEPGFGKSIQRCTDPSTNITSTGNNFNDLVIYESISPNAIPVCLNFISDPEIPNLPSEVVEPELSCEGLRVSELLVNPLGTDTDREYIELFNPTSEVIPLYGCSLQTSASSKSYIFISGSLYPGTYRAFSSKETGLTLLNSSEGTVWIISASNVELDSVVYPANIDDDAAWAKVDDIWQQTYMPTPDSTNISMPQKACPAGQERNQETGRCKNLIKSNSDAKLPCLVDQIRNPDTGRCVKTVNAAACRSGYTRNPETNRCRSNTSTTVSKPKPCKANEIRNPATNRCRKNVLAATSLAPCKAGQVRYAATNRCRKESVKNASLAKVKDVETERIADKKSWLITGLIITSAAAYGIYEWRNDIAQKFNSIKIKNK